MATKKNFGKSINENPALAFLGNIKVDGEEASIKKNYSSIDYEKKIKELERKLVETKTATETKSERVQLLVYPSILKGLDDIAKKESKSRNEMANCIFKQYINDYNK
ncbi:hypothetical protein [Lactococcus sp. DD01]|uniref:hypothetical protein n=1 Tax=Lactococcus sp. DD01 TaxID=1776443 RepID=UPI0007764950|nr:hypothetical protein [Lactococcus sp. DD01]KXT59137.1 hypothetical protein LACDD01_02217 [Lactococcus sp. DD01]